MIVVQLPPVYPILDLELTTARGWAPGDLARIWLDQGVTFLQVRSKHVSGAAFLEVLDDVVEAARASGARVIVNDRADLARMSGAAGVHVGQDDLPPAMARAVVGPDAIVGFSTHADPQVREALGEPVDYVAIGPVFATASKERPDPTIGLDGVRSAARLLEATSKPLVAIGGITLSTAASVLASGAASVAVISDLLAEDPARRIRAYLDLRRP